MQQSDCNTGSDHSDLLSSLAKIQEVARGYMEYLSDVEVGDNDLLKKLKDQGRYEI